jgi:hypothetical protein
MKNVNVQLGLKTWAAGFGLAAACLGAAHAQQVGTYVGTLADGHEVSIRVEHDGAQHYITFTGADFTLNCPKTNTSAEYNLAVAVITPVDAGHAELLQREDNFYMAASYDFKGDKIVGKIRGGVPLFGDQLSPPKAGQACNSINQKFTATYSGTQARVTPPAGVPQVISRVDREGRRVVEHISPR